MKTLTDYEGLQVVTPNPADQGGLAINKNFKAIADTLNTLSTTPTIEQLTINGPAGNGTNVTTAATPVTIKPFYPQTISFTIANTNGAYDGQTVQAYWNGQPGSSSGYVYSGNYWGTTSDGLFVVIVFAYAVGIAGISLNDQSTGWIPEYLTGSPKNAAGWFVCDWTPSGGFSGEITWTDENGNPQTFNASAFGGSGTATPILIDPVGCLKIVSSIQLAGVDTTQIQAGNPGTLYFDNAGIGNDGLWLDIGSGLVQVFATP